MPRPPRVADPEAFWHVITRGNRELQVFRDAYDRTDFLGRLGRVCDRHGWECHAYCLMGTHYHLLLGFDEPSLSPGMHQLNSGHAHMFNRRHQTEGHVFERRFWARGVRTEADFLGTARYVELNPVRAALVAHPRDWRWSSFRAHVGVAVPPRLLTNLVWDVLSPRPQLGREAWEAFVEREFEADTPAAAA
jgi:putative transposase